MYHFQLEINGFGVPEYEHDMKMTLELLRSDFRIIKISLESLLNLTLHILTIYHNKHFQNSNFEEYDVQISTSSNELRPGTRFKMGYRP